MKKEAIARFDYPEEFKEKLIELVVYQNQDKNIVAKKYGLPNSYMLTNWITIYKKKLEKGAVTLSPMEKPKTKDTAELKKRIKDLAKSINMKTSIDNLSDKELELYNYAESLDGTIDSKTEHLAESGIFEKYRGIHKSFLDLFFQTDDEETKLEILKRLVFLNWYSLVEPSCYTGVEDLDSSVIFNSYSILNDYLTDNKIDAEFKWMLSCYSSWDYTILEFSENKLGALTKFVKEVDISILHAPKKQLPKGTMGNRGQMGIYWINCLVEEQN